MKYVGLVMTDDDKTTIIWEWFGQADWQPFGVSERFEDYCKKNVVDPFIYVEIEEDD